MVLGQVNLSPDTPEQVARIWGSLLAPSSPQPDYSSAQLPQKMACTSGPIAQ